jgi:hypothetical protein
MIRKLLLITAALALMVLPTVAVVPVASATPASEVETFGDDASKDLKCSANFLGFPAWFRGLPRVKGTCQVTMVDGAGQDKINTFIFTIVLNIIEIGLRLVGFAAVGFIIYGGFKYLTSAGSADRIAAGRKIILNAVIGLVISFFSVAIVSLIAGNIT